VTPAIHRCAALALIAGCAWGDGQPFATVDAQLSAALEVPADRDLGGGWQQLASGYEVRIDALVVEAEELTLVDSGTGPSTFDPANPPPGYSNCHGGHCHADDGSLVDYADIEAELAGGGAGATEVLFMPLGELDLAAGVDRALDCEPDCTLPLAHVSAARMHVTGLRVAGVVRDGRAEPRIDGEVPFVLDLDIEALTGDHLELIGLTDLPADRGHDPQITMTVALRPTVALFDAVDWAALPEATPLDLAPASVDLIARLSATTLEITTNR
jgi:hypothetical protein